MHPSSPGSPGKLRGSSLVFISLYYILRIFKFVGGIPVSHPSIDTLCARELHTAPLGKVLHEV